MILSSVTFKRTTPILVHGKIFIKINTLPDNCNFRDVLSKCAITSCPNMFTQPESREMPCDFYTFPSDLHLRQLWLKQCGLHCDSNVNDIKICSDHFDAKDFEMKDNYIQLKPGTMPTRNVQRINAVPFTMTQHKNDGTPGQVEFDLKSALDINLNLKTKLQELKDEKDNFTKKINSCAKKISSVERTTALLTKKINTFKKRGKTNKEQRNILSGVFSNAQIRVLMGKRKVFWSNDDLAMAFSLRQMSSRECYLYLKKTLNFPLPALSCVQRWSATRDK